MIREVIRVQGADTDRAFHLLVTREITDKEDLEEVAVSFMMDQEQRRALIQYLADMPDEPSVVGFTIAFGVSSTLDPRDGLRIFEDSIRDKS